jgi:flagellar hook-associated protein 3 FlgL
MRITEGMRMAEIRADQTSVSTKLYEATERASSGLKVSKPSDDPSAFADATKMDAQLATLSSRQDVMSRAGSDLDLAESTLASAGDLMNQVRQLAVQAANGDETATSRADMAKQIDGIKQSLLGLANTKGSNGSLFSGTATATQAFDATGAFKGNDHAINVQIADGVTARGNASGAKAFTAAGGRDVFADLDALSTALSSNDLSGIQAGIDNADSNQRQITAARSDAGLTASRLQSSAEVASGASLKITAAKSSLVEIDTTSAYSDLAQLETAYQRSLSVTKQILSLPVFDPTST